MTNESWYLTREQVRALDAHAMTVYSMPGVILMENAGRGVSDLIVRCNADRQPVLIVCGAGNNGGDGFVIARHLQNQGMTVQIWLFTTSTRRGPKLPDDAWINHEIAVAGDIPITLVNPDKPDAWPDWNTAFTTACASSGWIVDALFGTGLTRPIDGMLADVVNTMNTAGKPIVAVDVPSGLDSNTGKPLGPTIRATHTATFVTHKTGFRDPASTEFTGTVHVVSIGVPKKLLDELRANTSS